MKAILEYFGSIILYTLILGLVYPWADMVNVQETYKSPQHWISSFIVSFILYNAQLYFEHINPRTFYYCIDIFITTVGMTAITFMFIFAVCLGSICEGFFIKCLWCAAMLLIYAFGIYAIICRGVAVYKKGKIRIFKFKIITYSADEVDRVEYTYCDKKCIINIVVNGQDNLFKMSAKSAKICEKRLKELKLRNTGDISG